jgi:hypothetical protein
MNKCGVSPTNSNRKLDNSALAPPVGIPLNVTLYWLTNKAFTSARLYWESKLALFAPKGVLIPAAVSVFPDEIYAAPRSCTDRAYPKHIHCDRLEKGYHFAAWEQPAIFRPGAQAAFAPLR